MELLEASPKTYKSHSKGITGCDLDEGSRTFMREGCGGQLALGTAMAVESCDHRGSEVGAWFQYHILAS